MVENCNVLNILRKAHVIASTLQFGEFDEWIKSELNGYSPNSDVPEYRSVIGAVKAWVPSNGWVPVVPPSEDFERLFCNRKLGDPISEIIEMAKKAQGTAVYCYPALLNKSLNDLCKMVEPVQFAMHVSSHQLSVIVEQVKNTVLEWTIRLVNAGVLGEEKGFSSSEKESAQSLPQTINNYYGSTNVINGDFDRSLIVAGNDNHIEYSYNGVENLISEIESALDDESVSGEDMETVKEMIADIRDKLSCNKKPSMIKAAFVGLKDFLLNVGASITASLIQDRMKALF